MRVTLCGERRFFESIPVVRKAMPKFPPTACSQ
jgi:hypothetical protein